MALHTGIRVLAGGSGLLWIALAASASQIGKPAAKPKPVDYTTQVKPLFVRSCYPCHGGGNRLGEFELDTREAILTGGKTHPVVKPGKGADSYLVKLVRGDVPGKLMPARGKKLTPAEVALLVRWIDEGASFGTDSTAKVWVPPLEPRNPALPSFIGADNLQPIDRFVAAYLAKNSPPSKPASGKMIRKKMTSAGNAPLLVAATRLPNLSNAKGSPAAMITPRVDDRTFYRRVSLDLTGLLPDTASLNVFLADTAHDKRERLVDRLLDDKTRYAEHWLSFWNDLLRNDYIGTGYIDGGRLQITNWLYRSLYDNKPYDQFVRELIDPQPDSGGFVKGIVWRGVVNASQVPEMQAAQSISQVFMGVNMKCASCHDSFINNWKLADAYGLASVYAERPLEMVRCDKPTGKIAPVKFIYPQLGMIDGSATKQQRAKQLADILVSQKNGRLARTIVNRLWTKLMGRGLVEPNDDMDARPWNPDLLDWLSNDLSSNGWDIKRTLRSICTSHAYQMPSAGLPSDQVKDFTFRGPVVKRMSGEQFADAVSTLTGQWQAPATGLQFSKGEPLLPPGTKAQVKFRSGLMRSGQREIDVDLTGADALYLVVRDGGDEITYDWADWINPRVTTPDGEASLTKLSWRHATAGYGQVRVGISAGEKPLRLGDQTYPDGIGTHANSVIAFVLPKGATRFRCLAGPDQGSVERPDTKVSIEMMVITGSRSLLDARAAMAINNPLLAALGRPNREQIVSQRATVATTLQALELTNGPTLNSMLESGSRMWMGQSWGSANELVDTVYLLALGRAPRPDERQLAIGLVGSPLKQDGIQDLLWAIMMLPEFQLVN